MTRQDRLRNSVIGTLLLVGIGCPIVSYITHRPAKQPELTVSVVSLPEVIITGEAKIYQLDELPVDPPEHGAAYKKSEKPSSEHYWRDCRLHTLEAQGSPNHPFVMACNEAK